MKMNVLITLIIYSIILTGLLLPYSFGLTYGKAHFAYESIPSEEFNYRYETTQLGFQTLFGIITVILVVILSLAMKFRWDINAVIVFFVLYVLILVSSTFLNALSGLGGPFPDKFLYGRFVMIVGTLFLFIDAFRRWYRNARRTTNDQ